MIHSVIPILRMFDEAKAREFYVDYLGFDITFEHRFGPDAPLYMGVKMGEVELHLSEHHGDGTPGTFVRLEMNDIDAFHSALSAKQYKYAGPGIQDQEWGFREVSIADPFSNKLIFCEPHESINKRRSERPETND